MRCDYRKPDWHLLMQRLIHPHETVQKKSSSLIKSDRRAKTARSCDSAFLSHLVPMLPLIIRLPPGFAGDARFTGAATKFTTGDFDLP
jgi:hypothetical protein